MKKEELQKVLHEEIPLTRAMELQVVEASSRSVILEAPLVRNTNHKRTAFGGSLYSLAVLSGWSLLYVILQEKKIAGHIVIHESSVSFRKPVTGTIRASCLAPSPDLLTGFLERFIKKGKARIDLTSRIEESGDEALFFQGRYVVHR